MRTVTLQFDKCYECPFYDDGGRDGSPCCKKTFNEIRETQKAYGETYEEWVQDDCPLEDVDEETTRESQTNWRVKMDGHSSGNGKEQFKYVCTKGDSSFADDHFKTQVEELLEEGWEPVPGTRVSTCRDYYYHHSIFMRRWS